MHFQTHPWEYYQIFIISHELHQYEVEEEENTMVKFYVFNFQVCRNSYIANIVLQKSQARANISSF